MPNWDDPSAFWDQGSWDSASAPPPLSPTKTKKTNKRTMSSNATPENNDILRALADQIADGCHTHEVPIGIKQNTEASIRAAITGLAQSELQVGLKKVAVSDAYAALATKDTEGLKVLTDCKLRLAQKLGQRWSAAWEPTGFPSQSTAVPTIMDERFTLLDSLKDYFAAVPANASVDMGATAAICLAAWTALSTARQAVANAESAQTTAFTNRTNAETALRKRVRGLIHELGDLIGDDDARWEDFGLNIPANPSAPESVASLTLAPASANRLEVSWPYAVRAIRYIIEIFVVGVDTEWRTGTHSKDLAVILKGFTAGQTVKVRIVAANDGGNAAPSPEGQAVIA
jgi:hypothetical protein